MHDQLPNLSLPQLELAWTYLATLSETTWTPPPPTELKHLSEIEWCLLDQLLQQELWLRARSQVH